MADIKLILLVEDDPDHELLTIRALKKSNIANEVKVARDGEEAIDVLFGENPIRPQVILLDLKLPKVDGLEVLRRIRESDSTRMLPVVILTSSDEERDLVRSYQLGVNSYIRKPVNFTDFAEATRQLGMYWLVLNACPSDRLTNSTLKIILVEDNDDDALLLERHLRRSGMVFQITRVQTEAEMQTALQHLDAPDVVLADYNLPLFSGPAALQTLKAAHLDVPFIMMSGAVSEETAVAAMRAGAHDYVSKGNLTRLVPAIDRELKEAGIRRNRLVAERALEASEARFHSLVEAMPLGLIISDGSGRITYANRAAERLLHYPESALLAGSASVDAICPALTDAYGALSAHTLSTEPFEAVCTTLDGNQVEVLIGVAFLNPEAQSKDRQLAAFLADLTIQKKSEELLRRTEKLAVAGRFAAAVSHEINNPLEAITNCLYLVSTNTISDEARTYLEMAQKELDRVSQITIQTLRFHRASTRSALVQVEELIETVLTLLDSRMRNQKIAVGPRLPHSSLALCTRRRDSPGGGKPRRECD